MKHSPFRSRNLQDNCTARNVSYIVMGMSLHFISTLPLKGALWFSLDAIRISVSKLYYIETSQVSVCGLRTGSGQHTLLLFAFNASLTWFMNLFQRCKGKCD